MLTAEKEGLKGREGMRKFLIAGERENEEKTTMRGRKEEQKRNR